MGEVLDVAVVGAGQAGLAVGYHLRRTGLSFALLDEQEAPGGAWRHVWPSLRLFSPAAHSSLPGRPAVVHSRPRTRVLRPMRCPVVARTGRAAGPRYSPGGPPTPPDPLASLAPPDAPDDLAP